MQALVNSVRPPSTRLAWVGKVLQGSRYPVFSGHARLRRRALEKLARRRCMIRALISACSNYMHTGGSGDGDYVGTYVWDPGALFATPGIR